MRRQFPSARAEWVGRKFENFQATLKGKTARGFSSSAFDRLWVFRRVWTSAHAHKLKGALIQGETDFPKMYTYTYTANSEQLVNKMFQLQFYQPRNSQKGRENDWKLSKIRIFVVGAGENLLKYSITWKCQPCSTNNPHHTFILTWWTWQQIEFLTPSDSVATIFVVIFKLDMNPAQYPHFPSLKSI